MSETAPSANRQIARAAGKVMLAFVLSSLTGLLRQILVANAFGTSLEMDAFSAANRVSDTLFNLVAGGALASAFIPTFTGLLIQEKRREAWKLASAIINLALLALAALSLLAGVLAPQIVHSFLAPGSPAEEALTVHLLRLMLPSAALFGLSGLVMGILNSHQVFFIPALTPSLYQLGLIFGATALAPRLGIDGLAWGVVIGSALHLGLQIPSLLRQRGEYFPVLGLDFPAVREVIRLLGPRLLGVAVVHLNFWVNTSLASRQADGSVAAITYGFTLMLMPQAAIAQSIAMAAMPTFSAQYARGQMTELRAALAASLRGILLLSLPASVGLILLRFPIIRLLYQRGEFDERSTQLVAWALLWYAAGLVGHCVVEILARAFYSLHDTKTPVLVGSLAMSLNVAFSFLFSTWFARLNWAPHGGLALANSLATALEMLGLLYLMRRKLNGLQGKLAAAGLAQAAIGTSVMAALLVAWINLGRPLPDWLVVGGGIAVGSGIYALSLALLGVPEMRGLFKKIGRG